jgi:SNF2 family DNA or RNA helicase
MELHSTGEVFWLECSYAEKDMAKEAKFLWHPRCDCFGDCPACAAGLVKKWWTKIPTNAVRLIEYADEETKQKLQEHVQELEDSRAAKVEDNEAFAEVVPSPEDIDYFPFQKAGIEYALRRKNTFIGDQMGLGKTIQALGIINATPDAKRAIVICPASLRLNWAREAQRWLVKDWEILVIHKNDELLDLPDDFFESDKRIMVMINYDKLGGEKNEESLGILLKQRWDFLIADEIHYCKSDKTLRSKAVLGVYARTGHLVYPGLVHSADKLVFLSGTPISNRPKELFPLLRALDPEDLGSSFMRFAFRYCSPYQTKWGWNFDGASKLDELQNRLRGRVLIRRLKEDVLKELPPKRRQIIELAPNGAQHLITKQAAAFLQHEEALEQLELLEDMAEVMGDKDEFLEATKRLESARKIAFEDMARERRELAVAKIPAVAEHVINILESSDSKVLVFAHHHDVIGGLEEAFNKAQYTHVTVTGKTSLKKRQRNVDAFQEDPSIRIFIGNIQAAGVGLTLTAADTVVFAEMDWVPANCLQAEDRAHRIGQENSVLVQYLVFDGSVDSKMAKTMVHKMKVIEQALDVPPEEIEKIEAEIKKTQKQDRKYPVATIEQKKAAAEVVQTLAGVCDGATAKDGMGFNKMDTNFGQQLAARSQQRDLTDGEVFVIKKMSKKYHRQLDDRVLGTLWAANEAFDGEVVGGWLPSVL